jgi:NAD(P)-dependent dehydrogenase (short-subunit alcohol dehydrogenase family)
LARAGIHVIATAARERNEIEAVARESAENKAPGTVVPVLADVTRASDCELVVDAAVTRFGRLDILVNNAGRGMKYVSDSFLTQPTRFWEISPETWRLIVDTNVNGPFFMARCAVVLMIRARWGRIINISVSRETMRRRGFSPYGPSKAAFGIGDDHLVARTGRYTSHRQRAPSRRSDSHWDAPGWCLG